MVTRKLENGALARAPCTFCQIGLSSLFPAPVSSFHSFHSLEMAQDGSKMDQHGPKMASRCPPPRPRTPAYPDVPAPKMVPRGPKMVHDGRSWPKMAPRGPKIPPRWPQEGFNMVTRILENGALAEAPCIFSQIALSSAFPLHVSSFLSFRSPEIAQNDSKMARDGLKMAPRWPPDGPQTPRTSAYLGVPRRTWGQFWVQDGPRRA